MQHTGLIVLFKAKGEWWQHWPGFATNQVGLRADRETSEYPQPPPHNAGTMPESRGEHAGKLPDDCRKESASMSAEGKLSEVKLIESNTREATPTGANAPPTTSQAMFTALAEICGIDWKVCTDNQRGALNQSEVRLRKAGATVAEVREFVDWWRLYDWRGKKNQRPKPAQVREEWGKFKAWVAERATGPPPPKKPTQLTPEQALWRKALGDLRGQLAKQTYTKAFAGTEIRGNTNGTVRVLAANDIQLDWLTKRLHDKVLGVLRGIDGSITEVVFEVAT